MSTHLGGSFDYDFTDCNIVLNHKNFLMIFIVYKWNIFMVF
jgi:hypothetical protein